MVFLIQNTQNRDSAAIQVKLDELIKALDTADNSIMDLEEMEAERQIATAAIIPPDGGIPSA